MLDDVVDGLHEADLHRVGRILVEHVAAQGSDGTGEQGDLVEIAVDEELDADRHGSGFQDDICSTAASTVS
jgi:hypothetical protein